MSIKKIDSKIYISVNEASNIFNKSIPTIRKLISDKKVIFIKDGTKVLVEQNSLENIYQKLINKSINKKSESINTQIINTTESPLIQTNLINNLKNENENLKKDKEKLYEDLESRKIEIEKFHTSLEKVHVLLENQQTLMLGLQQQIKTLTDNSAQNIQNIPEKPKTKHTTVEAKVSNSPQTNTDPLNFDFYDESNQVPVEAKKTAQKRRKWWFF
jgi:excisionase family DNA binding protein